MFLGIFDIDEYVPIPAPTHRFSSGAAYQPTVLTYSIYKEGNTTGLDEDVNMTPSSPFDAIAGCYLSRRQLTEAAGFERNKTYVVVVKATVDSVSAIDMHIFQVRAKAAKAGDAMSLSASDVTGNLPAAIKESDNIDFTATQTAALEALYNALAAAIPGEAPTAEEIKTALEAAGSSIAAILEDTGTTIPDLINAIEAETIVLPPITGRAYSSVVQQNVKVDIVQGDTPRLTFDVEEDYSGWSVYFGAKTKASDSVYVIDPKEGGWTDASVGQGYIDLTSTDTSTVGKIYGEIELRNGDQRLTPIKFTLNIIAAIIN